MKLLPGVWLVSRSLLRAFYVHRFRAVAAIFAGAMCVTLTTGVRVVAVSVEEAIDGTTLSAVADADWTVVSRSASGMSFDRVAAMKAEAPDAQLAPVLLSDTHVGRSGGSPLVVAGVTPAAAPFLPADERRALRRLSAERSGPEVLVGRAWAAEQNLEVGSRLPIETPSGTVSWRVAALVSGPIPNRGAFVVAPLTAVARGFERPGVADLVLASGPGSKEQLGAALRRGAGPAASVVAPDEAMASYRNAFAPTRNLLSIFVSIAVLAAGAILFFTWRLTLEDARESLARLRLAGARTVHLALASGIVLGGVFLCSVLIGAPLGILLGSSLDGFSQTLVSLTQLAASPGTPIARPLVESIGVSLLIFLVALGVSILAIRRMPVIEAVVGKRNVGRVGSTGWLLTTLVAAIALVLSLASLLLLPAGDRQVALLPLLVLLAAASLLTPLLVGALVRRGSGFASLAAGRELALSARRTAALLAVFGLAISMGIGLEGAAGSLKSDISRSVRNWTVGDLYVQTAESGSNLQEDKLAPAVLADLARVPGVSSVGFFTYSTVDLHDTRIPIWTWGPEPKSAKYAPLQSSDGPSGAALWDALGDHTVAVSSNYARLHGTAVGDTIAVPAFDGERRLRVVAVVDDLSSPAGMLVTTPSLYRALTGDTRIYQAIVDVAAGTSVAAVADQIRSRLGPGYPRLTVYDQAQIRDRFDALTAQLVQAFVVFGQIMFVLALLIGGATLATSLSMRERSLALTRLVGAPISTVWRQLLREAVSLGFAAWLIAAPIGIGLVYALIASISAQSGLLPAVQLPVGLIVISLPLAIVLSVLALLVGAPRRRIPVMVAALAEE